MDKFRHWLVTRLEESKQQCLEDVTRIGYTNLKWANPALYSEYDTFVEVLEMYDKIMNSDKD